MTRICAVFAVCSALFSLAAFGQTLPESARMNGGSAGSVIDFDGPILRPAELMSQADLVAHGRITNVAVRLDPEQAHVITEYSVEPIQALKQRKAEATSVP